jgi:DNA replication protein DnaT
LRIRTIKPEFTQDEELSSLPAECHLLASGLLCYADDDGYFNANPGLVKAAVFPVRETSMTIPDMLQELSRIEYAQFGTAPDGKRYGLVRNFTKHQVISHKEEQCYQAVSDCMGSFP